MTIERVVDSALAAVECGWVPDAAVRMGIRRLCARRLRDEQAAAARLGQGALGAFIESLRGAPIAAVPEKANAQHYEVPAEFYRLMLGPHLKYSCCLWEQGVTTLAAAEEAALARTALHAGLRDGHRVLELGCGWGSLSLWMAQRYPASEIVGVSNSAGQRRFIEHEARQRGLTNLQIVTADINRFDPGARFDRIVSVEMFEHMRNYHALLGRIASWLMPDGRLFVHVFCHQRLAYLFEEEGPGNWMGRHFFSGGLMPSADLLPSIDAPLALEAQWRWDGRHYERTANAWLASLDMHRGAALDVLARTYGAADAGRWLGRWRMFLMACAELFGYADGAEWGVAHYRFAPSGARRSTALPS